VSAVGVLLLVWLQLSLPAADEAVARQGLALIEARFAAQQNVATVVALARLHRQFPQSVAAARGLVWLGELALQAGDLDGARRAYAILRAEHAGDELGRMGTRGAGDVALAEGRWTSAIQWFDLASAGAPEYLRAELAAKRHRAVVERLRWMVEIAAWLMFAGALARFTLRALTRRAGRRWPREATFLAPLYLVLVVAGACASEPGVWRTLAIIAAGSLCLVALAFASPSPRARRPLLDGATLAFANLALFYIAAQRSGLIDAITETIKASHG
jgi:hypothetical protein